MAGKKWTKEEEEMLMDNWGKLSIETIAKRINRTVDAVELKGRRLQLGWQMTAYSTTEVSNILGINYRTVYNYMKTGIIEAKRDKTKMKRYFSTKEQIMKFMREHQDLWDTRKININLYNQKPKWYLEKEKADKEKNIKSMKRYSDLEIKIVIDRYRRGYTYEEIALEVGRTSSSVYKKIRDMDFGRNYNFKI